MQACIPHINLLLKVKESTFIKNILTRKEGGKRGPSPPPLLVVLQKRSTSWDPADWLIPYWEGPGGGLHCSAEAGLGALVLRALQEVEGHVAHIVHLIHLIPGTHAPVEVIMAEVSFLCKGENGPRGVIPPLPNTWTSTGVWSLQSRFLPFRNLSKVSIGRVCSPHHPGDTGGHRPPCPRHAQGLAHSRYSEQFIQQIPFIHPTFIMPSTVRGTVTAEGKCRHDLSSLGAYTQVG